jgi:uncharacterized protein YndB with AHSA1/START domain
MSPQKSAIKRINAGCERFVLKAHLPNFTPELLFNYWLKPDLAKQWWADDVQMAGRLGGGFRLTWQDMNCCMVGTYTFIERGKRLAFNWHWAHEVNAPSANVAIGFRPSSHGGASLMLMSGIYGKSPGDRKTRRDHIDCWTYFLTRLQSPGFTRERLTG